MLRTRSRSRFRTSVAILAVAIAVLVPAAAASASRVSYNGSVLTYAAASGESNGPIVTTNPYQLLCGSVPAPCLSIFDPYATISVPAGKCTGGGTNDVLCQMPSSIVANLGDRDDSYYGWSGDETIDTGTGNDNPVDGGGGNDHLNGGPGSDNLVGGPGNDMVDGGAGDDYLEGIAYTEDSNTLGSDTYIGGGGGGDRLTYDSRGDDLNLSLDGVANDGAPGENDNIGADVVTVVGGSGSDTFSGNAYSNGFGGGEGDDTANGGGGDDNLVGGGGNDRLSGADGQDILGGESGNDVLDGGAGVDRFWGDSVGACIPGYCDTGQDEIHARDGSQETINCGPGIDSAQVDNIDFVVQQAGETDQCESVDGAGAGGGGPGGRRAVIAVTYKAPRAGLVRARGIAVIGNRLTQVASATHRARRAGRVKLQLTLSAAADSVLKQQGALKVRVSVTFKPKHGRRKTTSRTLTLHPAG